LQEVFLNGSLKQSEIKQLVPSPLTDHNLSDLLRTHLLTAPPTITPTEHPAADKGSHSPCSLSSPKANKKRVEKLNTKLVSKQMKAETSITA
jgi:hypothetical protein